MKKRIIIILFFYYGVLYAQDIHFSQFYAAPLLLNPAATGNFNGVARVGGNYRDQWSSVTIPYRTFDVYADAGIQPGKSKNRLGIGGLLLTDQAGDGALRSHKAQLSAAYHLQLNKDQTAKLSTGIAYSLVQRSINYSALFFDSQWNGYTFDVSLPNMESGYREQFTYQDIMAGMLLTLSPFSYSRYLIGLSVSHINEPVTSFYAQGNQMGRRWQMYTGAFLSTGNRLSWQPMAYVNLQKSASEVVLGTNLSISVNEGAGSWLTGVWYRYYDAAWLMLGYMAGNLSVSASYDMNFSALTPASRAMGGLELALVYIFNKGDKKDPLACPAYE